MSNQPITPPLSIEKEPARRQWFKYRLEMDFSKQGGSPWWITIISILLALLICGIFIAVMG